MALASRLPVRSRRPAAPGSRGYNEPVDTSEPVDMRGLSGPAVAVFAAATIVIGGVDGVPAGQTALIIGMLLSCGGVRTAPARS